MNGFPLPPGLRDGPAIPYEMILPASMKAIDRTIYSFSKAEGEDYL